MKVQLVCQFGEPVRGVSPYGDALLAALLESGGVEVEPVDYRAAYPGVLHPAGTEGGRGPGELSWYSPESWRRVANSPADIMHIQHWAPPLACYLWPLASMARRRGKRIVVTVHNPHPHEQAGTFKRIEDRLLRSADVLLAHGARGVQSLRDRLGADAPAVCQVAHGMHVRTEPVVATDADYARLGLDVHRRNVLLFGNLRGYKGLDVLLEAWKSASEQLAGTRLIIAGRFWSGKRHLLSRLSARLLGMSEHAERLQTLLLEARSSGNVMLWEGFHSDADLDALIRVSSFAVFPYLRFSGQSGAACRAAEQGRPVLVSHVGGLPELAIDNSWVCIPGDSQMLADKLVEKVMQTSESRGCDQRQLDMVRCFDWARVADDHGAIYRELL
ncbi:glycosyltransferase [Oleiagrimonas soli]